MILRLYDNRLNILQLIDTTKENSLHIEDDDWVRLAETGASSLSFTLYRTKLKTDTAGHEAYNLIDDSCYFGFRYGNEDHIFTITELVTHADKYEITSESLNLELLNETAGKYESAEPKTAKEYLNTWEMLKEKKMSLVRDDTGNSTKSIVFDTSETLLKRLIRIADAFDVQPKFTTKLDDWGNFVNLELSLVAKKDPKERLGKKHDKIYQVGKDFEAVTKNSDKTDLISAYRAIGEKEVKKIEKQLLPVTKKITGGGSAPAKWSEGALVHGGHQLKIEVINSILEFAKKFKLLPSVIISQLYSESFWGDTTVGRADNNWSGMSGSAQTRPSGIVVKTGQRRPSGEGGTYFHYNSVADFLYDYMYLLRDGGSYKVAGKNDFGEAVKGFFRAGGAKYDYAAAGYGTYNNLMSSVRNGINRDNPGKLDKIDNLYRNPGTATSQVPAQTSSNSDKRIEDAIRWFEDRKGKVTYSMAARTGPSSYDCSSAIYYALKQGGFGGIGSWPFSTESEHDALKAAGFYLVSENSGSMRLQRGDILIWGKRGYSGGAGGHTMMVINSSDIIHCNFAGNGITVNNYASYAAGKGKYVYQYRLKGAQPTGPAVQTVKVVTKKANNVIRALGVLQSRVGQRIGSGQCYGVPALYSQQLGGPGIGGGVTGFSDVIGDTVSASNIGSGYNWGKHGWKVINGPKQNQIKSGQLYTVKANNPTAQTGPYGHTGVIKERKGNNVVVYEQNYAGRMYEMVNTYAIGTFMAYVNAVIEPPEIAQGATVEGTVTNETVAGEETYVDYELKDVEVTVKEPVYISNDKYQEWTDSAGAVEYYLKNGVIWAPQTRSKYPSQLNTKKADDGTDGWILDTGEFETDSEDSLIESALEQLRARSKPKVTYEIKAYDSDIFGLYDTLTIQDDTQTPQLIVEGKVNKQTLHPLTGRKGISEFTNITQLKSLVDTSLIARAQALADEMTPYEIRLSTDNGTIFKDNQTVTTITPSLWRGGSEVTGKDYSWRWAFGGTVMVLDTYQISADTVSGTAVLTVEAYKGPELLTSTHVTFTKVLDGIQGQDGKPGKDGAPAYLHKAYADSKDGREGFTFTASDTKRYLGMYSDNTTEASTDPTKYDWTALYGNVSASNRNYVLGTSTPAAVTYRDGGYIYNISLDVTKINPADDFWISFDYIAEADFTGVAINRILTTASGDKFDHMAFPDLKKGAGHISQKARWQPLADGEITKVWISIGFYGTGAAGAKLTISNMIVSHSNSAIDWQPAPEDTDTKISSSNNLTQEQLRAISEAQQIANQELKAKATIDMLDKWTTAYNDFVQKNAQDKSDSEAKLLQASQRIVQLQTDLQNQAQQWSTLNSYARISDEGFTIGKLDGSSSMRFAPEGRISMYSAGSEVMYISQGVIYIENGIFSKSIQIGNFVTREYNDRSNVVVYVGP